MARVLKIVCGLMGVLLLTMVGVMGAGRFGKEGPRLILFTYLDGDQPMLGWVSTDFRHMRPLGDLCRTRWYSTRIERPDENWLYLSDCLQQSRIGWTVKRIHVISGAEDIIATKMVPYGGSWSPDNQWLVYQERKTDHDQNELEVEWVRVAPDGSQRVVLTENIPATFWYSEESYASFLSDGSWIQIIRHVYSWKSPEENDDIYRIRIDGKEWENLTVNVDDLSSWLRVQASGLQINLTHAMLQTALEAEAPTFPAPSVCLPGDAAWILAELPTKHLKVITDDWMNLRGVSTLDGSVLWQARRDRVWVSPDEEWILLGQEDVWVGEQLRWDGSNRRMFDSPFRISNSWSPDLKWLVYVDWDRTTGQYFINRMAPESGTIETLFTSPIWLELIAKSPDGQRLYFSAGDYQTKTFAFYTMRFDGSDLTHIKILDPYPVDHIERFIGPINRHWQPPILAAIALTLITAPILITALRRRIANR